MAGGTAVRDGGNTSLSCKISHPWKGPYRILVVGPGISEKGELVGDKLLLLEIRRDEPGVIMSPRVSVLRGKRCHNPKDDPEPPKSLPWGLRQYVLNQYSELSPPLHLTEEDVSLQLDTYRMSPTKIASHRISRGLRGKISVQYLVHWGNMERPRWEHEEDLKQYGRVILTYWLGSPSLEKPDNPKYRKYRINLARREEARQWGQMFVANGYELRCDAKSGCYVYYRTQKAGWQLAQVMGLLENPEVQNLPHTVRTLDLGKKFNVHLRLENLNSSRNRVGDWCLHFHVHKGTPEFFAHTL